MTQVEAGLEKVDCRRHMATLLKPTYQTYTGPKFLFTPHGGSSGYLLAKVEIKKFDHKISPTLVGIEI